MNAAHQEMARALAEIGAVKFGEFKIKLHTVHPDAPRSPIYIDLRLLRRYPKVKALALSLYRQQLEKLNFDLLADIPTAGTPLCASLSDTLQVGMITPRLDKKGYGSGAKIDGMLPTDSGKTAALIDDLITVGTSKIEIIEHLRENNITVKDVVVLIDREQGGADVLQNHEVNLHAAMTLTELLDAFIAIGKIDKNKAETIQNQLHEMEKYVT